MEKGSRPCSVNSEPEREGPPNSSHGTGAVSARPNPYSANPKVPKSHRSLLVIGGFPPDTEKQVREEFCRELTKESAADITDFKLRSFE